MIFAHKMPANKDTWEAYKLKIKDKRCKKGKALPTGKGLNSEDLILQKGETVVQSLIAEVAGKAQKYNSQGLLCDVLAGDQGASCSSVHQLPDLKVKFR